MAFPLEDVLQALSFFFLSLYCRSNCRVIPAIWCLLFLSNHVAEFSGQYCSSSCFCFGKFSPFSWHSEKKKFNSCGPNNAPKLHLGHKTCLCGWLQINLDHLEVFNVYRNLNTRVFWFSPPSKNPLVFNNGCISWIRAPFSISLYTTSSDIFSFVVATVC